MVFNHKKFKTIIEIFLNWPKVIQLIWVREKSTSMVLAKLLLIHSYVDIKLATHNSCHNHTTHRFIFQVITYFITDKLGQVTAKRLVCINYE